MARHGGRGFGAQSVGGAPEVSAGTATLILITFFATIWVYARAPKTAGKLVLLSCVFTFLMLMGGVDNVLESSWACWGVLIGGWWLSDHLRKEQAARKARASTQEGERK